MTDTTFDDADVIEPLSNAERQRRYRQRHGSSNEVRRRYRHNNSKHVTDAAYLSQPIVMFDGEGYTGDDGIHRYNLFAAMSSESSVVHSISNNAGLSTMQVLDMIADMGIEYPGSIYAIYGGSYDINMLLRDLTDSEARRIYDTGSLRWEDYRLQWRRGKQLTVKRRDEKSVVLYDVVSFFQRPFVDACDEYLCTIRGHDHRDEHGYTQGEECWENRNGIVRSKARRGTFTPEELDDVADYNASELRNGIRLIQELRTRLNAVNLRPRRWDGPGAIAAALLTRERIKDARATCPPQVARAARYAYAGGRFELIRFGHCDAPAWEADLNSAYPAALATVPNLAKGEWELTGPGEPITSDFALVQIQSEAYRDDVPAPLFCRLPNGAVSYPQNVTGWYWSPEYHSTVAYCEAGWGRMKVLAAWQFRPYTDEKPFDFIHGLYLKRKALKAGKDGAHVGIKLALNSLYGKLAQQVGAREHEGKWRLPPYHQLEWAGYTTSWCRANMLRAALTNLESVIAFETDAVFTSAPLDIPKSDALGEFEDIRFENLTYVQSGIYFADTADGAVTKSRGVDKGGLSREDVLNAFSQPRAADRHVVSSLTRFLTLGVALMQGMDKWRKWITMEKKITVEPTGKRIHSPYCWCMDSGEMALGRWHVTLCPHVGAMHSSEYPVMWINPDAAMSKLEELRRDEHEYD